MLVFTIMETQGNNMGAGFYHRVLQAYQDGFSQVLGKYLQKRHSQGNDRIISIDDTAQEMGREAARQLLARPKATEFAVEG